MGKKDIFGVDAINMTQEEKERYEERKWHDLDDIVLALCVGGPMFIGLPTGVGFASYSYFQNQNRIYIESVADTNKDGVLSSLEKANMYEMCGVPVDSANSSTYELTISDIKKGLKTYEKQDKTQ